MATVKLPSIAEAEKNPAVKAVYDDIRATRKSDFINNIWRGSCRQPRSADAHLGADQSRDGNAQRHSTR